MSQKVSPINQRIVLELDVRMPFEAFILKRLMDVPKKKRQAWLGALLVLGFKRECGELRELQRGEQDLTGDSANASAQEQDAVAHKPESAGPHQLARPTPKTIPQAVRAPGGTQENGVVVSFAALRKVIG